MRRFHFIFIVFFCCLMSPLFAQGIETRILYTPQYLAQVKALKASLIASLESAKIELQEKKYPQAYFMRSLQEQVRTKNFLQKDHFTQTIELLTALGSSVDSQHMANRKLVTISSLDTEDYVKKLKSLEQLYQKENRLMPIAMISDNGHLHIFSISFLRKFVSSFSLRDQVLISIAFGLMLYLFIRPLMAQIRLPKKTTLPPVKTSNESQHFSLQQLSEIPGVGICIVNNKNMILKQNTVFSKIFKRRVGEVFIPDQNLSLVWDKDDTKIFKLLNIKNSSKRYLLNKTSPNKNGEILYLLNQIDIGSNEQTASVEEKSNFIDLIENSMLKYQSYNRQYSLNFRDTGNWTILSSEMDTYQEVLNLFFKAIYFITLSDERIHPIKIIVQENKKILALKCTISGVQLREEDFKKPMTMGKKVVSLNGLFGQIKTFHPGLSIHIKAKNGSQNESEFYLEVSLNRELNKIDLAQNTQVLN